MDHGSSAAADRTACESLVTTSMRQAAATVKMRSRPRCGPCRALSLAADMKAALLYDQPRAGNSVQDSAQIVRSALVACALAVPPELAASVCTEITRWCLSLDSSPRPSTWEADAPRVLL